MKIKGVDNKLHSAIDLVVLDLFIKSISTIQFLIHLIPLKIGGSIIGKARLVNVISSSP